MYDDYGDEGFISGDPTLDYIILTDILDGDDAADAGGSGCLGVILLAITTGAILWL